MQLLFCEFNPIECSQQAAEKLNSLKISLKAPFSKDFQTLNILVNLLCEHQINTYSQRYWWQRLWLFTTPKSLKNIA